MSSKTETLLSASDPPPVRMTNPAGRSLFLLVGDHAGNLVPERLEGFGLTEEERNRHIAWDIGVADLGRELATWLDATFIEQRYSRLVIDCNRAPTSSEAIVEVSDGTPITANAGLSVDARECRIAEIFDPYHAAIAGAIVTRLGEYGGLVVVSLHSFTPSLNGTFRPWEIGVLYEEDSGDFAIRVRDELSRTSGWNIGDNEPYRFDETDYTVPVHACRRNLAYVELEVRQDILIEDCVGVAATLASALGLASRRNDDPPLCKTISRTD